MYNLGKEEAFLGLANDFNTKIVVDEDRFKKVKALKMFPPYFGGEARDWSYGLRMGGSLDLV